MNARQKCRDCEKDIGYRATRCTPCNLKFKNEKKAIAKAKLICHCGGLKGKGSIECKYCREKKRFANKTNKKMKPINKMFLVRGNITHSSGMQYGVEA